MDTYMEMGGEMGSCCVFTLNQEFIKEHRELAKKLMIAHQESIKYAYRNPYETAKIFAEYYDVPEEIAIMTIYKKCIEEGRTLTWELTEDYSRHAYDFYKDNKMVEEVPEFEDMFDIEIYEEAGLDDFSKFIEEEIDEKYPVGMTYEEFKSKIVE